MLRPDRWLADSIQGYVCGLRGGDSIANCPWWVDWADPDYDDPELVSPRARTWLLAFDRGQARRRRWVPPTFPDPRDNDDDNPF